MGTLIVFLNEKSISGTPDELYCIHILYSKPPPPLGIGVRGQKAPKGALRALGNDNGFFVPNTCGFPELSTETELWEIVSWRYCDTFPYCSKVYDSIRSNNVLLEY